MTEDQQTDTFAPRDAGIPPGAHSPRPNPNWTGQQVTGRESFAGAAGFLDSLALDEPSLVPPVSCDVALDTPAEELYVACGPLYRFYPDWALLCTNDGEPAKLTASQLLDLLLPVLDRTFRWNRFTQWSVLDHLVLCKRIAEDEGYGVVKVAAVSAHDIHEGLIGDMPRPLSKWLELWEDLDMRTMANVQENLGLGDLDMEDLVQDVDDAAAAMEAYVFGLTIPGLPPVDHSHRQRLNEVARLDTAVKCRELKNAILAGAEVLR